MSYYNTNNESGNTLRRSRSNSTNQEQAITAVFNSRPGRKMTPFDVQDDIGHQTPITSIRRAITNLTIKGVLKKCDTMKLGRYSKMNHCWELNR